jgi:glycosyltransferase involved in cell wall biosynthesis
MRPLHLLLVHQAFVTPREHGGTRHYEFGQHWVRSGNRMTVVASDRSYQTGEKWGEGEIESSQGLDIRRAYTYPSLHRSFVWRVVSFLSFAVTSLIAGLRARDVHVVMGTTPPMPQALTAWLIAALKRRPFLLEVRDLWPEFAIDMGVLKNKIVIWIARRLERFLYARANHILVNSPAYRDHLIQEKGISPAKITLIANGVDANLFKETPAADMRGLLGINGEFVAMYAGALGLANDIRLVLDTAERLSTEPSVRIVLVGDGKERANLERQARTAGLRNVIFAGSQPKASIPAYLAAADCCIAVLQNIPMFTTTYPNKVFDYMAAGKPTVLAIDGVIRKVIEAAQGGIFVRPGDPDAMAEAILQLQRDRKTAVQMGANAQRFVAKNFDRAQQAQQFIALVSTLAKD